MVLNTTPFKCPDSLDEFFKFKENTLPAINDMLGESPFKKEPPLNPRIMYATDCGAYFRKKVRYGNESDDVVWAWLLVPKAKLKPVPAIICLPGSFMTPNWGKDGPAGLAGPEVKGNPESYGKDLANLGYVTLCPDYPCAGERTTPGLKAYDTKVLDQRFPSWTRVGLSAWDVSRAVDFLLTVPEVDSKRIGCTGWSQGGMMSLLGAALDPRIAVIVSVCGWSPFRNLAGELIHGHIQSYNYPRLRKYAEKSLILPYDMDHFAALIAPRPFLDIKGTTDHFFPNIGAIQESSEELKKVYNLLDARGYYRAFWYKGDHAHNSEAARESQAWFYRWLWNKSNDGI